MNSYRKEFPVTEQHAYFQHPAVSALPERTREVILELTHDMTQNGCLNEREWDSQIETVRNRSAELLGVAPERVGFVTSTSYGLSWLAESIPFKDGETVLIPDCEFPANQFPWLNLRRRGVTVETIPTENGTVRTGDIKTAISPETRVLSFSSTQFQSGFRADLKTIGDIAHENETILVVDAIQSLGWDDLPPEDLPVDALVADGHKWMCGPEGAGIIYLNETLQDLLEPGIVGWYSVEDPYEFDDPVFSLREDAGVVELGSRNTIGLIGFGESLSLLLEVGLDEIRRRVFQLRSELTERLLEMGFDCPSHRWDRRHQSPIVTFDHPELEYSDTLKYCRERNVQITRRGGRLRAGVHFYNNSEDINRLIEALETIV